MKPGIYSDVPNDVYHSGPGISKSGLDLIHRSPLHFQFARTAANENARAPTPAQALGTAFHALLLEPEAFARDYVQPLTRADVPDAIDDRDVLVGMIQALNATRKAKLPTGGTKAEQVDRILEAQADLPEALRATRAELEALKGADLKGMLELENVARLGLLPTSGSRHELAAILAQHGQQVRLWSDVLDAWHLENAGRKILTPEDWARLHAMRDAALAHPAAAALLTKVPGRAEQSVFWVDPLTGELCRCRPDFWRDDGIVVDVKTTDNASPEGFARSIFDWRYHVQEAFYRDGIEAATGTPPRAFLFLAVETKAPHAVAVYALDPEAVELGRADYQRDLQRFSDCSRTDTWPGYGDTIQKIQLPAWAFTRADRA
jgi:exodeoxyribonuclease VIII